MKNTRNKKIISWVVIFSLLGMFSLVTTVGLFKSQTKVALAETIEQNGGSMGAGTYIEMIIDGPEEDEGEGNNGHNHSNHPYHMICEVSPSQYAGLQSLYTVTLNNYNIHGHDLGVVTVQAPGLTKQVIKNYLASTGNQYPNCHVPKFHNIFFLIFNANLS